MTATLSSSKDTRLPDGWSRDKDGTLRLPGLQAFQLFGALLSGERTSIAYVLNLAFKPGMTFPEFMTVNHMEPDELAAWQL